MLEALIKRIPSALLQVPIVVIMGGPSPERTISLRSGKRIEKAFLNLGFETYGVEYDQNIIQSLNQHKNALAFLATHGSPGEDGKIQGLLESINFNYTHASVIGSSLCIHKTASKALLRSFAIPTPEWMLVDINKPIEASAHQLAQHLHFPLILKPIFGGSSIGIRLCHNLIELRTSLEDTLQKYQYVFAEKYISGREFTVSILEDSRSKPYPLPVLEVSPKHFFYDYECKLASDKTDFSIPEDLGISLKEQLQVYSLIIHKHLMLRDTSRSDFIIDRNNQIYYLETNSIPGMTELSNLPAQAKANGMTYEELCVSILLGAYRRSTHGS